MIEYLPVDKTETKTIFAIETAEKIRVNGLDVFIFKVDYAGEYEGYECYYRDKDNLYTITYRGGKSDLEKFLGSIK